MSLAQETITSNVITLKGSTAIVKEFFHYSVNSILYQRGIYPPESFKKASGYNLTLMVTADESLIAYLNNILRQLEGKHKLLRPKYRKYRNASPFCSNSLADEWKRTKADSCRERKRVRRDLRTMGI